MKKEKAPASTPTPIKSDSVSKNNSQDPRVVFINSAISMSWQLAVVVLVPVLAGVWVDDHYKTSPAFTLVGLGLAVIGVVFLLKKVLADVSVKIEPKVGKK
jgi:F0F1-type ATP synthase assembly protein I